MSVRAMTWALRDADVDDPVAVLVLVGLADHAGDDGRGAWPSRRTLATYARVSVDTVDRRLAVLLERGLITPGDQELVAHLRPDRRPIVYDLPLAGPQAAAPHPERGRRNDLTGPQNRDNGAAAVRHRTVLKPSRTIGAGPHAAAPPPFCHRCGCQHPLEDRCDSLRPPPLTLRQMVQAARA